MGTGTAGSLHLDPQVGSRHKKLTEDGMGFRKKDQITQNQRLFIDIIKKLYQGNSQLTE